MSQKRKCEPCTACCDGWVQMNINGSDVYPGCACPHSTGSGCDDYANRPVNPCVNFVCGWVQADSPLPDWMRPSEAGAIVLLNEMTWAECPVDLAIPVGHRIPDKTLDWLKQHAENNMRPLIYLQQPKTNKQSYSRQQEVLAYGPPEFQQHVLEMQEQGLKIY